MEKVELVKLVEILNFDYERLSIQDMVEILKEESNIDLTAKEGMTLKTIIQFSRFPGVDIDIVELSDQGYRFIHMLEPSSFDEEALLVATKLDNLRDLLISYKIWQKKDISY